MSGKAPERAAQSRPLASLLERVEPPQTQRNCSPTHIASATNFRTLAQPWVTDSNLSMNSPGCQNISSSDQIDGLGVRFRSIRARERAEAIPDGLWVVDDEAMDRVVLGAHLVPEESPPRPTLPAAMTGSTRRTLDAPPRVSRNVTPPRMSVRLDGGVRCPGPRATRRAGLVLLGRARVDRPTRSNCGWRHRSRGGARHHSSLRTSRR